MAFAGLLGAGLSLVGSIAGGMAQQRSADYQAQVAQNNAKTASQNAVYAEQAGQEKAAEESQKGAQRVAAIRAAQAASGIDVNTGSAVDVQAGQREADVLSTNNIVNNAALQSYGYRTQETNFNAQAGLDKEEGSNAMMGGLLGGFGSLLGNAKSTGVANLFGGIGG